MARLPCAVRESNFATTATRARVNIEVHPLIRSGPEQSFLILFEQSGAGRQAAARSGRGAKPHREALKHNRKSSNQEVLHLQEELARTREYVQAIIRDQEATNEELKSSNEEALSSMEELQSTNEELETAKEELQSSNEELITLNEQLQNRNSELGQLSIDLGNVLAGVDIPIVILGEDRRIRRFTPPAEKLLALIGGDIGRPIGNLRLRVHVPDLDDIIEAAIQKGAETTRDVRSEAGRWYSLRVHPFVGIEDKVEGVLMAFVDIDELKKLQQETAERAVQSESTALALLETAAQAIVACDAQGEIILANASAEKMFGHSRETLIGRSVESLIPERGRANHAKHRADWFAKPLSRPMGIGLELAGRREDGSEFPVEVSLSFIGANNRTVGVAFVSDITERRKSEQTLAEYSARLASEVSALDRLRQTNDELWRCHELREGLEKMVDAGIALLGADLGNIQLLDPEKKVLRIVAQRGFGPDFLEHFREVSAAETSACGQSLRSGRRIFIEDVLLDPGFAPHRAAAAAAGYRAVQSTPLLGTDGMPVGMFSTHFRNPHRPSEVDLARFDLYASQAAQFIQRLEDEAQLQRLTRSLLAALEEGSREIARELHDVFSQELIAIGMELSSLKKDGKAEADQAARLSELSQKIADVAKRLHQTSRNLHPAVLEELGIEPALRQECENFQRTYGIPTHFTAGDIPSKIPLDVALCLYRVAQESLRNIYKHAKDTEQVWVSLAGSRDGITLVVKDRGDGFDLDAAMRKGGLGLISMEERVQAESGKFTVQSRLGEGTTVTAFLPLGRPRSKRAPKKENSA